MGTREVLRDSGFLMADLTETKQSKTADGVNRVLNQRPSSSLRHPGLLVISIAEITDDDLKIHSVFKEPLTSSRSKAVVESSEVSASLSQGFSFNERRMRAASQRGTAEL